MSKWYVLRNRLQHGPFTPQELKEKVERGVFKTTDYACDMEHFEDRTLNYVPISEVLTDIEDIHIEKIDRLEPEKKDSVIKADLETAKREETNEGELKVDTKTLLEKVEAIELVDSSESSSDAPIKIKSAQIEDENSLAEALKKFMIFALPATAVIGVLAFGAWGLMQMDFGSQIDESTKPSAKSNLKNRITKSASTKQVDRDLSISVPEKSDRAQLGFEKAKAPERRAPARVERPAPEPRDRYSNEAQTSEIVEESPRDRLLRAREERRKRLKKLRNELEPEDTYYDEEPFPGVVAEDGDNFQDDYDRRRGTASTLERFGGDGDYRKEEGVAEPENYSDDYYEDDYYEDERMPVVDQEEDLR